MPRGYCRRHAGQGPCSCAMGNLYRFTEPLVLYWLESNGATYGYILAGQMKDHALTDAEIDRGALYRTLQRLEENGYVVSSWDTTGTGPARHLYEITSSGQAHLREWAVVLGNLARSMEAFVGDVDGLPQIGAARPRR